MAGYVGSFSQRYHVTPRSFVDRHQFSKKRTVFMVEE